MRFLLNLIQLLLNLPWWGGLLVLAGLAAFFAGCAWYLRYKLQRIFTEAVLDAGASLRDAQVVVHSATPAPVPAGPSPYDSSPEDEEYAEGIDGEPWDDEDASYYLLDVTITLADPGAKWDPSVLALVPADFAPDEPMDVCPKLCALHSAEFFADGRWRPQPAGDVRGPRRLRMLFAIGDGIRTVKFVSMVTYFGHVQLPPPLPKRVKVSAR
jgi:hypothetical protein